MTKRELLEKMENLLKEKGMHKIETAFNRIDSKCNKATIEDAIKCLEATDEEMNDYLTVVKLVYPNTYKTILKAGNWLTHSHNRYYVWTTAKMVLA